MLIGKRNSDAHAGIEYSLGLQSSVPDSVGKLYWNADNGSTVTSGSNTTALPLSAWSHVTVVWGSGTYTFYLNATPDGTGATVTPQVEFNTFRIGSRTGGAGTFITGRLDDCRAYNRALTASEVQQLYNLGR